MAENVGSSDIWSDGVEKSANCRTQTQPLTLLLLRLPPHAKRHLPPRRQLPKSLLLLQRNPRQRNQLLPQKRLLLAPQRNPLLLKRNTLFYCLILQKTPTYPIGWSLFYSILSRNNAHKFAGFSENKPHFSRIKPVSGTDVRAVPDDQIECK